MKTLRRTPSSEGKTESRISAALRSSMHTRFALPLAAHEQAEVLAKKKGGSAVETFLVKPDYAYPNTRMNRDDLRAEMNKPSAYFHDLRLPHGQAREIGLLKLEVLQCFGLPKLDAVGENDTFCLAVVGSYAFKTDVMPPVANPMWLSKMRRACTFPLFHAYARLYLGVFDDDGEAERDDFVGRVVLDVARMRPGCIYDVTLPLRQSSQVYMRRARGAVRFRFHVSWYNERAAMLSYIPKGAPKFEPHESVTVNCCDKKSFQNVALVVHGTHPPGRFSMKLVKALVREINFTRIHILRYLRKRELANLVGWKNPIISGFFFGAWMHSVYANTVRYIPGNLITFLLLYLWKNYPNYAISGSVQRGFLPPTWEEMFMALLYGKEGRQYIQPLEMTRDADVVPPTAEVRSGSSDSFIHGYTIDEIAEEFQEDVKVSTHRVGLRVYRRTFTGSEAVDFLVNGGFAASREEAVLVGCRLVEEKKLFEHVHRKQNFKDGNFLYHFTIQDASHYKFATHEAKGKTLFRMLGFLDEDRNFSKNQLEMPYSDGVDHPRLTVKEALVIRSKDSKTMLEKLLAEEEEDDTDASALGFDSSMELGGAKMFDSHQLDRFDSYFDLKERESAASSVASSQEEEEECEDDAVGTVKVLKKPPLQDIDYKARSDRPISEVLAETRHKVHGVLLHCFNDRTYVVRDKETASAPSNLASTDEATTCSTRSRTSRRSDQSLPTIPEGERDKPKQGVGSLRRLMISQKRNSKNKSMRKSSKSDTELAKEENDKLLKTGAYSNSNRWVAKLGVIVQPIVEIAYEWIYLFRALFNIFTWQDPILSFWISIIGPVVVVVLHLFPWRVVLGVLGLVLFGPQNWVVRVMRERKGVPPPDPDKIINPTKQHPSTAEGEETDEPLFCNATDGNKPLDYAALDHTNVKHIAVPYSPLMYNHRFYDWPPENDYARVLKEDPEANSIQQNGVVDTGSVKTTKSNLSKGRSWRPRLPSRRSKKKR